MRRFLLYFLLLGPSLLRAQDSLTVRIIGDSAVVVLQLDEVVVFARRSQEPSLVTRLNAVDIRRRGGGSAADVLRQLPSLTVTSGPKTETQTRIRGFQARDVLVLVDGRPINPGYYGKADLSMLPKDMIEKIKIVKGPASVAYGANTMGGVINIITRNDFEPPSTRLDLEAGSNSYHKMSLNHVGRMGSLHYWLSGYEELSKGFLMSGDFPATSLEDGGVRDHSGYRKMGVAGKLGYRPSDRSVYNLSLDYHWARKDISPSIYSWDDVSYRELPWWVRYGSTLSGQWQLSQLLTLKSVLFADAYHDRFLDYRDASRSGLNDDSILENWTLGGSSELFLVLGPHRLHSGLHFRRDLMNKKPDTDEPWYTNKHLTGSFFAEDRLQLSGSTQLTGGFSAHLFVTENGRDSFFAAPMLALNQTLPFQLNLHLSGSRAIRFPTMHQLYSESSGNEDLLPEEAWKGEVGLRRDIQVGEILVSADAAFFSNRLKNLIYRAAHTFRYANIDDSNLTGWELQLNTDIGMVSIDIGYSRIFGSLSTAEIMQELPQHQLSLALDVRLPWGAAARYSYNYFSERTTYLEVWLLGAYAVHNVSVTQPLFGGLLLRLRAANLLDANFQEELGYPAPGRQVFLGLIWQQGGGRP